MKQTGMKVALIGVAGFNRGDDAISECLLQVLLDSYRFDNATVAMQRSGKLTPRRIIELPLRRKRLGYHLALARLIVESDLVVIGGGSIIQDEFGSGWLRGITSIFAEVAFLTRLFGRKLITAPIGVDDLITEKGRKMARYVLDKCDAIVVRDHRSYTNAVSLVDSQNKIHLAADPVFAYPAIEYATEPGLLVVCPAFEGRDEDYLMSLHQCVIEEHLDADPSHRCVLLAMDDRGHEDAGKIQQLFERIDARWRLRVTCQVPNFHWKAARILRSADVLFAMRLHALILAAGYVPTFCLSRGTKTEAISEELGIPRISLSTRPHGYAVASQVTAFIKSMQSAPQRANQLQKNMAARIAARQRFQSFEAIIDEVMQRSSTACA